MCEVWWARTRDVLPRHDRLLAQADLDRRDRLASASDRRRLTAAWAVARLVVGGLVGERPPDVRVDRTCPDCGQAHGRPRLPDTPEVHLSVSHSGGRVVVAVAHGCPVGVDVERVTGFAVDELDLLTAYALAPEERVELTRRPAAERAAAFTAYWVRKEAVGKATGRGLAGPLDELVVSPPSAPPRLLRWGLVPGASASVSLHGLDAPRGYAAALALADDAPAVLVERDARPVLLG